MVRPMGVKNVPSLQAESLRYSRVKLCVTRMGCLLAFVFAFVHAFEHGESGLFGVGNRERFRRIETGKHLADGFLAGRTFS